MRPCRWGLSLRARTALRPMRPAGTAALLSVYSQSKSKGRSDELIALVRRGRVTGGPHQPSPPPEGGLVRGGRTQDAQALPRGGGDPDAPRGVVAAEPYGLRELPARLNFSAPYGLGSENLPRVRINPAGRQTFRAATRGTLRARPCPPATPCSAPAKSGGPLRRPRVRSRRNAGARASGPRGP